MPYTLLVHRLVLASVLFILVLGIYGTRLTTLTLRGEEPRRAAVAKEMLTTGEWFVPRLQGHLFLTRPPLQNWSIAVSSKVIGDFDRLAIRLPSALAVMLMTLVVFWYTSHFLRPAGAFAAGVSFATMAQVMELGRLGETEALFTVFVGASLLVWHLGYSKQWPAPVVWMAGYAFAALGALTKGSQAPVYFVGVTCLFLVLRRDWRWLFAWSHLVGILLFAVVFGVWGVPFYAKTGWSGVGSMLFAEVSYRFSDLSLAAVVGHLVVYPFQLLVCMLPWSAVLLCFCDRKSWHCFDDRSGPAMFALISLGVALPTCWIPPGAHERYMMPLYPLVAVLIGVALQLCYDSKPGSKLNLFHRAMSLAIAAVMLGSGLIILVLSFCSMPDLQVWAQPRAFAVAYALLSAGAAGTLVWARNGRRDALRFGGLMAVAVFMGVSMTGVFVNTLDNQSVDSRGPIEELKKVLPAGHRLVSLGPVNPLFGFLYRDPIERIDNLDNELLFEDGTFFCVDPMQPLSPNAGALPFGWREVAVIPVARRLDQLATHVVIVGRSDPSPAAPTDSDSFARPHFE